MSIRKLAMIKFLFILCLLIVVLVFTFYESANAQVTSSGVGIEVELDIEDAPSGSLICAHEGLNSLCSRAGDTSLVGVITSLPAASFSNLTTDREGFFYLLVDIGPTAVRVSNSNGNIAEGDFITTSEIAGVGVKATENGQVLGKAMENFDSNEPGDILVDIAIHYTTSFTDSGNNLFQILRKGLSAPVITPLAVLRYLVAGAILIATFILTFLYFGRISRASIEAIGRNPLGSRFIQLNLILNLILMTIFTGMGLGLAYLILAL